MTDEIPLAAYNYVDKLANTDPGEPLPTRYRTLAARLAHENGLVPKEPDVPLLAMKTAIKARDGVA